MQALVVLSRIATASHNELEQANGRATEEEAVPALQWIRWPVALVLWVLVVGTPPPPVQLTAQQDHQRLLDLLHIPSLRPGADGRNTQAANAANYDESKANPYPNLPDPLLLENGKKVKSPKVW